MLGHHHLVNKEKKRLFGKGDSVADLQAGRILGILGSQSPERIESHVFTPCSIGL